jgi:hypothetical protein
MLKDTAAYILALPKSKQQSQEWQAAIEALLMAAENRGPLTHARIGVLPRIGVLRERKCTGASEAEAGRMTEVVWDRAVSLSDRNRSPNPRRYLYPRRETERSLSSAASIDTHASAITAHAARPVYQKKVSIMTPPLTKLMSARPYQPLAQSRQF